MDFKRRFPLCRSSNRAEFPPRSRNQLPRRCDRLSVPVELTFISFLPGREREFRQLSFGFASANPETRHAMHAPTIPKFHQPSFNLSFYLKIVPTNPLPLPSSTTSPCIADRCLDNSVNSSPRKSSFVSYIIFRKREDRTTREEEVRSHAAKHVAANDHPVFPRQMNRPRVPPPRKLTGY